MEKTSHIVLVPTPGMGHLIPLVEFTKRLVTKHNLSATFMIQNTGPLSDADYTFLDSLPTPINHLLLPPVNLDDLPQDVTVETKIILMVKRSIPFVHQSLKSMIADKKKIVAVFADLFSTDVFDVAIEFGVPPYVFFPASAMCLSFLLHLPKFDQMVSCEYRDLSDPIQLPSCIPIHGRDLMGPVQDRNNEAYKRILDNAKRFMMAKGIVVNSFKGLEGGTIEALQQHQASKLNVYPVGPLIQSLGGSIEASDTKESNVCMRWLDGQPRGSVLYICFGSRGALSLDQVMELAMGLELSEQRFLWVVRTPNDKVDNPTHFSGSLDFLPKGFIERTKDHGLVVSSWVPQARILSHGSIGGFMTHCGWNSILESIVHGVSMIAWPLHAEQKMNAVLLIDGLKVALRVESNENDFVDRLEIARVVKGLFEGEEGKSIRIRIREFKEVAVNEFNNCDGCSNEALDRLAFSLENKI